MRAETSKQIKGAMGGMNRLADIMNSLGTTCLASLIALILFLFYNIFHNWLGTFSIAGCGSFVLGFLMLIVHYRNYKGVIEDYENIVRSILLKEFELNYEERYGVIELHVFQNDLGKESK
jgi:hypothetical protein